MLYFVGHKGHCCLGCDVVKDPSKCIYFFLRQARFVYNYLIRLLPAFLTAYQDSLEKGVRRTGEQTNASNCISLCQRSWPHPTDIQDDICSLHTTMLLFPGFFKSLLFFPARSVHRSGSLGRHRAMQDSQRGSWQPLLSSLHLHRYTLGADAAIGYKCCIYIEARKAICLLASFSSPAEHFHLPLLSMHGGLTQPRSEAGSRLGRKISSYLMGIANLTQYQPFAAFFEGSGKKIIISGLWCWPSAFGFCRPHGQVLK